MHKGNRCQTLDVRDFRFQSKGGFVGFVRCCVELDRNLRLQGVVTNGLIVTLRLVGSFGFFFRQYTAQVDTAAEVVPRFAVPSEVVTCLGNIVHIPDFGVLGKLGLCFHRSLVHHRSDEFGVDLTLGVDVTRTDKVADVGKFRLQGERYLVGFVDNGIELRRDGGGGDFLGDTLRKRLDLFLAQT